MRLEATTLAVWLIWGGTALHAEAERYAAIPYMPKHILGTLKVPEMPGKTDMLAIGFPDTWPTWRQSANIEDYRENDPTITIECIELDFGGRKLELCEATPTGDE